jgi:molybdopterin molybdotransferase
VSGLIPVDEALARVLDGTVPMASESVPLGEALGRVLAAPLAARRTQPPTDVSAMDGYAVRSADVAAAGAELGVIGAAPAGTPFTGAVGPGEAVRIFTGAAVPPGADAILLQEDAEILEGGWIRSREAVRLRQHIRARGLDFAKGDVMLPAGTRLGMRQIALAAAMNHAQVEVRRRPRVAILATGDELVPPGTEAADDRIVASNGFGIAALVRQIGGEAIDLGIVPDDRQLFAEAVDRAVLSGADILVTLGGASVGDHDLAREVLAGRGMELGFWKIAMRPGKPLIFGRIGETRVLGLPGNPVSSLVCALLFLKPLLETLLGLPGSEASVPARLGAAMPANDRRQDYVRALLAEDEEGQRIATPLGRQDSSMLSTFAEAGCLIIRPPHALAANAGEPCRIVLLP